MREFALRRVVGLLITLACASVIVFAVLEILPGDPARVMLGPNATQEAVDALRAELGLDRPALARYVEWAAGLMRGDFGSSHTYSSSIGTLLAERAVVSLPLALAALALTIAIAIPVGITAAANRGGPLDTAIMGATQFGIAIPNFWFAILLVYVFAATLRIAPSGGFPGWDEPLRASGSLALPAIALAVPQAAILSRVARSALIETLGSDYIRTARAKGASQRRVLWAHATRNALVPILTIIGLQFAFLLSGVIIIEQVFSLPGVGRLAYQAIRDGDLPLVRGIVMALVASVVIINFFVDIAYAAVDPRLRHARS